MLTIEKSQELIGTLLHLRLKAVNNQQVIKEKNKFERECIKHFEYLVTSKLSKYKQFSNYDDLYQEGMVALVSAMKTYDPTTGGLFFWWAHKYIDTRISRCANQHTTIRVPLHEATKNTPHKVSLDCVKQFTSKMQKSESFVFSGTPENAYETKEFYTNLNKACKHLSDRQKNILFHHFGFSDEKFTHIDMCKKLNITRSKYNHELKDAISISRRFLIG
jgi:RNA polymerase sigma factor (sigma-70 family)